MHRQYSGWIGRHSRAGSSSSMAPEGWDCGSQYWSTSGAEHVGQTSEGSKGQIIEARVATDEKAAPQAAMCALPPNHLNTQSMHFTK